jgi:hypothetical protein
VSGGLFAEQGRGDCVLLAWRREEMVSAVLVRNGNADAATHRDSYAGERTPRDRVRDSSADVVTALCGANSRSRKAGAGEREGENAAWQIVQGSKYLSGHWAGLEKQQRRAGLAVAKGAIAW